MPLNDTQKKDALDILNTLYTYSQGRRVLSTIFKTLPDKETWKEYYDVIPQPRSLDGVKVSWSRSLIPLYPSIPFFPSRPRLWGHG